MLLDTGGRDNLTDAKVTILNIWSRFSFDRINDSIPHFLIRADGTIDLSNIQIIARLLNTAAKWTRPKFVHALLCQLLVPLPAAVRRFLEGEQAMTKAVDVIATRKEVEGGVEILEVTHRMHFPPSFGLYQRKMDHALLITNGKRE